jgi:hypothetical protein
LNQDEENLLQDYVLKALAHFTMYRAYPFLSSKLVKSTLTKIVVEEGDVVEQDEAKRLSLEYKSTANYYAERLLSYLGANSDLYPEYETVTDGEVDASPDKTSQYGFNLDC